MSTCGHDPKHFYATAMAEPNGSARQGEHFKCSVCDIRALMNDVRRSRYDYDSGEARDLSVKVEHLIEIVADLLEKP